MAYANNYKEVLNMPGRDGTGPMGAGTMTGRGLGPCAGAGALKLGAGLAIGLGLGLACRHGFGRGFANSRTSPKTQKKLLNEQKTMLQDRLEAIEKQMENL